MSDRMIGICGGGIGGLSAAIALRQAGIEAAVFEQADRYGRVGADINLTPNSVRALDGLGVGDALRDLAARPTFRISRMWNTGEETSRLPMSGAAEQRYGAPQLTLHRADLLNALHDALPNGVVRLRRKLVTMRRHEDMTTLCFADGSEAEVDAVVGADGIHSVVRTELFGPSSPTFTGVVAYRAVVPSERLDVPNLDAFTKWWGPNAETQLVVFPLTRGREIFVFATTPRSSWRHESWTTPGSVAELRAAYRDFHPDARAVLAGCDEVLASALYVRDPMTIWSRPAATLLGDACHPMMPFMAQGAGMAIEDAVVLARCVAAYACTEGALKAYEVSRLERTSRVQTESRSNEWLKTTSNADWLYGYDAWTIPLFS
jgi:salicylate hydroxylase